MLVPFFNPFLSFILFISISVITSPDTYYLQRQSLAKSLDISFLYNSYWVLSCISWEIRWTFLGIQHFRLKDLIVISSQKSYKQIWSYWLLIYSLIHLLLTFICLDSIYLANGDLLIHLACTQYALNTLMKWSIQTEIWHGLFGIKK